VRFTEHYEEKALPAEREKGGTVWRKTIMHKCGLEREKGKREKRRLIMPSASWFRRCCATEEEKEAHQLTSLHQALLAAQKKEENKGLYASRATSVDIVPPHLVFQRRKESRCVTSGGLGPRSGADGGGGKRKRIVVLCLVGRARPAVSRRGKEKMRKTRWTLGGDHRAKEKRRGEGEIVKPLRAAAARAVGRPPRRPFFDRKKGEEKKRGKDWAPRSRLELETQVEPVWWEKK